MNKCMKQKEKNIEKRVRKRKGEREEEVEGVGKSEDGKGSKGERGKERENRAWS